MRSCFVLITLLFCSTVWGQDLVVKSFIKDSVVQLRWAPRNYDDLVKGLKSGYQIRMKNDAGPETMFEVKPFLDRDFGVMTDREKEIQGLLKTMVNSEGEGKGEKLIYAMLMIAAGPEKAVADLCGVYCEVTRENGEKEYQVSVKGTDLKSNWIKVDHAVKSENQIMTDLIGHQPRKRTAVYLEWEADELKEGYSGYWIEKSFDGQFFKRLNTLPYTFLKSSDQKDKTKADFLDSLVQEGETYYYRIQGINHFGDAGQKSNVVQVYIPRFLKGECRIDTVYAEKNQRTVKGRFLFNNDSDIGNLKDFFLYRSDSMFHSYEQLETTKPDRNYFTFIYQSKLFSGDKNYFKVAAVSQDQDTAWSYPYYFFTLDQEPPSSPTGLNGEINDSGVVSLRWNHNTETDIRGYRVFMSNSLKEEFVEAWNRFVTDSVFFDTLSLNNLTSEVFYKVSAVDLNFNNSSYSEIIKLEKPDTIPPVPCVFKNYIQSDSGISLVWVNSTSSDVSKNQLIRRKGAEEVLIVKWKEDSSNSTVDNLDLVPGKYEYQIRTEDMKGNSSVSSILSINYEPGYRKVVDSVYAEVDRLKKEVHLNWSLSNPNDIYSVQVYRKKGDEKFRLLKTIRTNLNSGFTDKDLSINNVYHYKVKMIYKSGVSSKLSEAVEVLY